MYKIMGADQREYGPVGSDALREWIAQGRANAQTLASFEGSPWKALASFPEFADALRTAVPPPLASGGGYGAVQETSALAISGLVFSILGLCCICAPFGFVGLGLSIAGLVQIQRRPQAFKTSKVIPITGIVISLIGIVVSTALGIILMRQPAYQEMLNELQRQR